MVLVQLDHVSKSYGATDVLVDVSWQIKDDARIGLIGPNGCGKTTLAKLVDGELSPTSGTISRVQGASIGYLQQESSAPPGYTVRGYVLEANRTLVDLHARIVELEHRIAEGAASEAALRTYGSLRDKYEHRGGYEYESRCEMVLSRLGFGSEEYDQPVEVLSGGQLSRLGLAALLIREPDLLLLDEPTNHLDIEATEWLEGFLGSYSGSVVIISHDRVFLDRVVTEIAELEDHRLVIYPGNYSAYTAQKAERRAQEAKAYRLQQEMIERTEEFIRRNIAGQKTKQAQSRRKQLEKLERLAPPAFQRSVRLSFVSSHRGGNEVLEVRALSKAYGDLRLFDSLSFLVRRGERIGVIGPNGSGKSTLLRMLVGEEEPDSGIIRFGVGIEAGYYDQRREGLDESNRVIDEVWSVKPALLTEQIRSYLGSFLFSEDEQFRVVGTLSGGEQSRVALAKLILGQVNFLILDEPTNHLDIVSRLALEDALERYEGTFLVVSHDRAFLSRLTSRILRIERGQTKMYEVGYKGYEAKLAEEKAREAEKAALAALPSVRTTDATPSDVPARPVEKVERIAAYEKKRRDERKRRRRARRFAEIEDAIMGLENRILEVDDELASPSNAANWAKLRDLAREREETKKRLDALYEQWAAMEKSSSVGLE